jgi:hypothetical protein
VTEIFDSTVQSMEFLITGTVHVRVVALLRGIFHVSAAHGRVVELADQLVAGAAATISFLSKIRSYAQKYLH